MLEVGLSGVVAPTLQDLSGPGKDRWVDSLSATQGICASFNRSIFAALGPHATDTVSEALEANGQMVRQWDVPIHAHLAQVLKSFNVRNSVTGLRR